MGGLPERLATPRRAEPRLAVPAGSVGIGGGQTGIYPATSPGGWQRAPNQGSESRDVSSRGSHGLHCPQGDAAHVAALERTASRRPSWQALQIQACWHPRRQRSTRGHMK